MKPWMPEYKNFIERWKKIDNSFQHPEAFLAHLTDLFYLSLEIGVMDAVKEQLKVKGCLEVVEEDVSYPETWLKEICSKEKEDGIYIKVFYYISNDYDDVDYMDVTAAVAVFSGGLLWADYKRKLQSVIFSDEPFFTRFKKQIEWDRKNNYPYPANAVIYESKILTFIDRCRKFKLDYKEILENIGVVFVGAVDSIDSIPSKDGIYLTNVGIYIREKGKFIYKSDRIFSWNDEDLQMQDEKEKTTKEKSTIPIPDISKSEKDTRGVEL